MNHGLHETNTILGISKSKDDFEVDEDPLIASSKFKIALDAGILHTLEKGTFEEIQNIFENNDLQSFSYPEIIFKTLKKFPTFLKNDLVAKTFWSQADFQPQILELIFLENPQFFVDEFEDNLIFYLEQKEERIVGDTRILQFCAFSKSAYERMLQILVTYAYETDFDIRMCSLISELVTKVNLASENPIALQKAHLKPLITLLLVPPCTLTENNVKLCKEIMHLWTDLFFRYPNDAKNCCLFYMPWFKCILRQFPNFQIFLDLKIQ